MRTLSGIKPTGIPHLGNYFGMLTQCVELQHQGEGFYFLANYHALNQVRDAALLRDYTMSATLDLLAAGLDPNRCTIFRQSDVPEVTELTWILGTVTPMGLLQRAHAYKDALAKDKAVDFGLFAYPVLMAADILLYDSDVVPVGKDQVQHVELTRDMAIKFNTTYCKDFDPQTGLGGALKLPQARLVESTAVIPGTDGQKMSKSYGNTIEMFAADKPRKKAVMGIVTDSTPLEAPKNPETCNVFALLKLFCSEAELSEIAARYRKGGIGYGDFKKCLLEKIEQRFNPMREIRNRYAADPGTVEDILREGAGKARRTAREVLDRVRSACGLA